MRPKIVVGYDGTHLAEKAIELACKRARCSGATICLVYSLHGQWEDEEGQIRRAEEFLNHAKAWLDEKEVACESHLLIRGATPGEDLVTFAEECNAEEIIVGLSGKSEIKTLIFGSNTTYTMCHSPCPVTTIR